MHFLLMGVVSFNCGLVKADGFSQIFYWKHLEKSKSYKLS